ncbi:MAG: AbrB/MazE/SpoVT family DNA-binding domain-containing protein [Cyanobacteria bacterium J06642_11]
MYCKSEKYYISPEIHNVQIENIVVSLGPNGRVLIPAALRQSLHLAVGDRFVLKVDEAHHTISLERLDDRIAAAEGVFQKYVAKNSSVVDELIAERRQEAASE